MYVAGGITGIGEKFAAAREVSKGGTSPSEEYARCGRVGTESRGVGGATGYVRAICVRVFAIDVAVLVLNEAVAAGQVELISAEAGSSAGRVAGWVAGTGKAPWLAAHKPQSTAFEETK